MRTVIFTIIAVFLSAAITWIAWNSIAPEYLNDLPLKWHHLDFWSVFCMLWVMRAVSVILRVNYNKE